MILIAHRGNINGKVPKKENTPEYIQEALDQGYHVEVDVYSTDISGFWLGHDRADHSVSSAWLKDNAIWCHAKTFDALEGLIKQNIHCFYHHADKYTLTSKGYIWAFPGQLGGKNTIAVHPDQLTETEYLECSGLCSDYVSKYKHLEDQK